MKKKLLTLLMALAFGSVQTTKPMEQTLTSVWHLVQTASGSMAGYLFCSMAHDVYKGNPKLIEPSTNDALKPRPIIQVMVKSGFMVAVLTAAYTTASAGLQGLAANLGY